MNQNRLILKANGVLTDNHKVLSTVPANCLGHQIVFDQGVSLRTVFQALSEQSLLCGLNEFYPSLLDEYRQCPDNGCLTPEISGLIFYKTVEMVGHPENRLDIYITLTGENQDQEVDIRFLELSALLDHPIRLGKLKHVVFGDMVDVFQFETVYTLFELVDGLAWALSFQGSKKHCEIRR